MTAELQQFGVVDLVRPWHRTRHDAKRVLDLVVATLMLLVLAPLLLFFCVAIRATSRGPVIFRQTRIGKNGQAFVMRKFRTMVDGAEQELAELRSFNEVVDSPLFKIRRDPRMTTIGRWMRKLSIDEIPQLFNVLGGSMSLVGPRPALPTEVAQFSTAENRRLLVPPGLTGLCQVNGRSDLEWHQAIQLDLRYVENWTIPMDLLILLRTLPAVITTRGAY